jgi:hypothetical protein
MKPAVKDWRLASLLTKTSKMKNRSIIGNMWMHLWHMWYSDKFRIHVDFNELIQISGTDQAKTHDQNDALSQTVPDAILEIYIPAISIFTFLSFSSS